MLTGLIVMRVSREFMASDFIADRSRDGMARSFTWKQNLIRSQRGASNSIRLNYLNFEH